MTWIFGSFLVTPSVLVSCHILISKQVYDSTIRAVEYNRCVTGRRSRDENHAVSFRQSAENRSRARDTQVTRGVSGELARECKRWLSLAPDYPIPNLYLHVTLVITRWLLIERGFRYFHIRQHTTVRFL